MIRHKTRKVVVGGVGIGGNNPVRVQSMCNTKTEDVEATIKQIKQLEEAGCELVRVAVPNFRAVEALPEIRKNISIPLIADIHYDYRLALASIPYVDKLRINPGTLGSKDKIRAIVERAKQYKVAIRVGINTGSLERRVKARLKNNVDTMLASVAENIRLLERLGFEDIIVALKSSDVVETIEAYRRFSKQYDYPLHLGLTEAGLGLSGAIRSAIAIGVLLSEGIGDTIRVSLTGNPVEEVRAAYDILSALKLREYGAVLVSCPTCSRCSVDLLRIVKEVKQHISSIKKPIKIAIMGCEVNGPGEAKEADVGLAFSHSKGFLFKHGKIIQRVEQSEAIPALIRLIDNTLNSS
ncbi:4-hydroxy-3-methylbut-2-en-1-yl diphosphate synthase [Candidatus Woesearchaeota archaeon]|nr:flavodoxin-dependent (E)-4-hydroxy-3-methylbut-2-enyl-diphosphate synthase [Candidatus Woesearchaeota archaeon]RLE43400.1 MAG: 4-hydroxy-3-methylbut-2-en-1-yl diphosphate synthase [Candidatus Woesearchaeota archaeon]